MEAIRAIGNSILRPAAAPAEPGPGRIESPPRAADSPTQEKGAERITRLLQQNLGIPDIQFNYSVHKPTGTIVVKVINKDSGEVIREIPPEELLAIAECIIQELHGLFYDQKI